MFGLLLAGVWFVGCWCFVGGLVLLLLYGGFGLFVGLLFAW